MVYYMGFFYHFVRNLRVLRVIVVSVFQCFQLEKAPWFAHHAPRLEVLAAVAMVQFQPADLCCMSPHLSLPVCFELSDKTPKKYH